MTDERKPLIQVKNLDVHFGQVKALTDVSVDFHEGEFIGLVGDNGAGKTTLIKVLCGIYKPTKGEVYYDGARVTRFDPKVAIDMGIETIQQAVGLCDNLSVARNYFLGREPVKRFLGVVPVLDFAKMR